MLYFYEQISRSCVCTVKGLWDKPPDWWDPEISFLDPNNGRKSKSGKAPNKKPTKKDLLPILQYLVSRYKVSVIVGMISCV